jgi:NitT/TauT family transport system ATP-binding protein
MQTRLEHPERKTHADRSPIETYAAQLTMVTRRFARRKAAPLTALAGLTLEVLRNEVVAVVGASGVGKTTLLELVCGLQAPDEGTVEALPATLMPQQDLLLPWLDAAGNAALALRIAGVSRAQARASAQEMLLTFGLEGFEHSAPRELSGGMRQRVAFIRTLLAGHELLCLDEPFGALDAITRAEMQVWLSAALTREPRSVLLVTHDVEEAIVLADRVLVLAGKPGRIVAELAVDLPRPRIRTHPRVTELREAALAALR